MGKKDRLKHGVFLAKEDERGIPWSCDFTEKCREKAIFIVLETYESDEPDCTDIEQRGACYKHALDWAEKDNCEGCIRKIKSQDASLS